MGTSNTRHALAPWENRLVVVDGTLKTVRRKPEGGADILLVNCKVRLFDPDAVLDEQPYVALDHMWDRVLDADEVPTQMLTRQTGAGLVHQYARADGSVDWTVHGIDAIRLDNLIVRMLERLDVGAVQNRREYRRNRFRTVMDAVAEGVPVYSMTMPTAQVLQTMQRLLGEIDEQLRREALAPAHGPCRRMHEVDPFAALRRRKKKKQDAA